MKLKIKFPVEEKGGPGSGFHGHAGRPGHVGGSSGEGGTPSRQLLIDIGSTINKNVPEDNITYNTINTRGDDIKIAYFGDKRIIEKIEFTIDGSDNLWLDNIQVAKSMQGKGIGTRILDSILSTTDKKLYIHRPWNIDYWNHIQSKSKYKDRIIVVR